MADHHTTQYTAFQVMGSSHSTAEVISDHHTTQHRAFQVRAEIMIITQHITDHKD